MANSLDKFRKGVAQWSGNIGSAGISDAVVKTVPLASTSGLPTDTAVMITVNRVDTNGKKTGNYEGIVGVVSGSNLIDCIRGVEGTAQAWTGGTVVEVLHTASNINELIDGILAEHNQDGTHKDTLVTSLKATGAEINTGTEDAKIVTPKAIADASLPYAGEATSAEINTGTIQNKYASPKAIADSKVSITDKVETLTNKTLTSPVFQGTVDGWISASETWEYVSVDDPTGIFRVNADVTTKYSAGMRIKFTNGGNVIYGIITVVSAYEAVDAGYTHITFLHQIDPTDNLALYLMANSAITLNYYSTQKAPQGFPLSPAKWKVTALVAPTQTQSTTTDNTWYNVGSFTISVPIGAWNFKVSATTNSYKTGATSWTVYTTVSTTNNSEVDAYMTTANIGTFNVDLAYHKEKYIELTSKTSYYLLSKHYTGEVGTAIRIIDGGAKMEATCAYL